MYLQSNCFSTYTPTTTDYHTTTTPYITSTSSTSSTTSAYTTDSDLHKGDDITYTPTQTSYTSTTSSTSSTSTTTAYPLTGQPGPAPIPAGNVNHNQHFFSAIKFSPLCHHGHKYYTVCSYHGLRWFSKTNLVFIVCFFLCVIIQLIHVLGFASLWPKSHRFSIYTQSWTDMVGATIFIQYGEFAVLN